jgi:hypothetical protein
MTRHIPIGIKTSPQAVDWATLDAMWARIGTYEVFESVWMNDHVTDIAFDRHGPSLEAMTAMAALAHHVPSWPTRPGAGSSSVWVPGGTKAST